MSVKMLSSNFQKWPSRRISQLICPANQLAGFNMIEILANNHDIFRGIAK